MLDAGVLLSLKKQSGEGRYEGDNIQMYADMFVLLSLVLSMYKLSASLDSIVINSM